MIGLSERRLSSATGLRATAPLLLALTDPDCIVPSLSVSTRASYLAVSLFASPVLPFAQTLCVTITQSSPAVGAVQFFVEGLDDDGEFVREVTPLVPLTAKTTNRVYLARIFQSVTQFAYRGTFAGATTMVVGVHNDLSRVNSGVLEHVAPGNMGWATLNKVSIEDGDDQVAWLRIHSVTTGEFWIAKPGAVTIAYSEPGWVGSIDKFGIDFAQLFQPSSGAAPTYTPGDIVYLMPAIEGNDPLGY